METWGTGDTAIIIEVPLKQVIAGIGPWQQGTRDIGF